MFRGLVGIVIGIILITLGYHSSFRYPIRSKNPDDTSSHLRYLHIESSLLILGGLFILVLSIWLLDI